MTFRNFADSGGHITMTKVVYLPLDERPCNYDYPKQLSAMTDFEFVLPDRQLLGRKKKPAKYSPIQDWLLSETKHADYLILSIDLLVYGGIVPSRLHHLSEAEWRQRLTQVHELKKNNPFLKIYAFNLIMRAPAYNSSEEEPDYYEDFGELIFKYGWLSDKAERGGLTAIEEKELETSLNDIPDPVLTDFLERRKVNTAVNRAVIDLVEQGVIDFLIIPLDDNSKFGYTAKEQRSLIFDVEGKNLFDQVHIYPGADEIGCTLLARVFTTEKNYVPKIHARYSSTNGPFIIPKYEDRRLNESVKAHVTAAGGILTDASTKADVQLLIHSPAVGEKNVAEQIPYSERDRSYFSEVNIRELAQVMDYLLKENQFVALADVATCNGADHALMKLITKMGLHHHLQAYAGWNTSGNSIGTVLAHAVIGSYYFNNNEWEKVRNKSYQFYASRVIEDWGYQSIVRQKVVEEILPRFSADYFDLNHAQQEIETYIQNYLTEFIANDLNWTDLEITQLHLPWNRMFEVGFTVNHKNRLKVFDR